MSKIEIIRQLKVLAQKDGQEKTKEFAQDILDLIDQLESEADSRYFEGKAEGMETMAQILCGSVDK